MLPATQAYADAIIATRRKIVPMAEFNLISPDIVYGAVTSSGEVAYSNAEQLHNKVLVPGRRYATLERGRWRLNGTFFMPPASPAEDEVGAILDGVATDDRTYPGEIFAQLNLSGLSILQAAAVYFSDRPEDGVARDFKLDIYSGGTSMYTAEIKDNYDTAVYFEGFTVYNVTAIRVTPTKWSRPGLRPRVIEIVPGVYEIWDGKQILGIDALHETAFDCMRVPYGVCTLTINNKDLRFNPHAKNSIFLSITERQGIPVKYGVQLPDKTTEYKSLGVFYQQEGGWETAPAGLDMTFKLVDIVGLICKRKLDMPGVLPTVAEGWIALIVSHLGVNFVGRYIINPDIAGKPLTASADSINAMELSNLLRYVCMCTGAYFCADQETGYLRVDLLTSDSSSYLPLEDMFTYPAESANDEIADITFRLADGSSYVVGGTTTGGRSLSVQNPFIHTREQANEAARNILSAFSGTKYVVRNTGDMRCELGDLDIVQTVFETEIAARRYKQQFNMLGGVMLDTPSHHVQATGALNYTNRVEITENGTWAAPAGVTELFIVLVPGGDPGSAGASGSWESSGKGGNGGKGGRIFISKININSGQTFNAVIGEGGTLASPAQATVFGAYSSANGTQYPYGWADATSGNVYGAPGDVGISGSRRKEPGKAGAENTGNGGQGGSGGYQGVRAFVDGKWLIRSYPADGGPGGSGGSGVIVVYYD